jgi:uncharacterized membrane protein
LPNRDEKRQRYVLNLSLAGVAALAGLASIIIVFTALFVGLWLDNRTDNRALYTISLLLLSVPVSLYTMLKIVMGAVSRIVPQPPQHKQDAHVPETEEDESF